MYIPVFSVPVLSFSNLVCPCNLSLLPSFFFSNPPIALVLCAFHVCHVCENMCLCLSCEKAIHHLPTMYVCIMKDGFHFVSQKNTCHFAFCFSFYSGTVTVTDSVCVCVCACVTIVKNISNSSLSPLLLHFLLPLYLFLCLDSGIGRGTVGFRQTARQANGGPVCLHFPACARNTTFLMPVLSPLSFLPPSRLFYAFLLFLSALSLPLFALPAVCFSPTSPPSHLLLFFLPPFSLTPLFLPTTALFSCLIACPPPSACLNLLHLITFLPSHQIFSHTLCPTYHTFCLAHHPFSSFHGQGFLKCSTFICSCAHGAYLPLSYSAFLFWTGFS